MATCLCLVQKGDDHATALFLRLAGDRLNG